MTVLVLCVWAVAGLVAWVIRWVTRWAPAHRSTFGAHQRGGRSAGIAQRLITGVPPPCWYGIPAVIVGLAVGWPWGVPVAAGAVVIGRRWLRRRGVVADRAGSVQAYADLPLVAELLAAALESGAPIPLAADEVGRATGGAVGHWLVRTAAETMAGRDAELAWSGPPAGLPSVAGQLGSLLGVAQRGGLPPIGALRQLAADIQATAAAADVEDARRRGVRVVAPLGLCFLPAFVLVGVVPIAAGAFHRVLP